MARKWFLLGLVSIVVLPSCMSTTQRDVSAAIDARSSDSVALRPVSSGASDSTGSYMIGQVSQLTLQQPIQAEAQASAYPVR